MDFKKILNQHLMIKHYTGSKLYGTDLPTSDTDFGGIFIPPVEALVGLSPIEQIDLSKKDKSENGKNTTDATDEVYFSLHKFARLAMQGNPNVLEWLFVPTSAILVDSTYAKEFREKYEFFLSKHIIPRFVGYACAQKHKMVLRSDKWQCLHAFREYLNKFEARQVLVEIRSNPDHDLFCTFNGDNCVVGDLNIQRTVLVKKAIDILSERIEKGTNRQDTILKYGYDTKFGSHLIRLLLECKELLLTEKLILPLRFANRIKDIKIGKVSLNEVLDEATEIENEIRNLKDKTQLPENPDFNEIEDLVINITLKELCWNM